LAEGVDPQSIVREKGLCLCGMTRSPKPCCGGERDLQKTAQQKKKNRVSKVYSGWENRGHRKGQRDRPFSEKKQSFTESKEGSGRKPLKKGNNLKTISYCSWTSRSPGGLGRTVEGRGGFLYRNEKGTRAGPERGSKTALVFKTHLKEKTGRLSGKKRKRRFCWGAAFRRNEKRPGVKGKKKGKSGGVEKHTNKNETTNCTNMLDSVDPRFLANQSPGRSEIKCCEDLFLGVCDGHRANQQKNQNPNPPQLVQPQPELRTVNKRKTGIFGT